jgi:hypothetical protein
VLALGVTPVVFGIRRRLGRGWHRGRSLPVPARSSGFVVLDELGALGSDAFCHEISAEQIALLDQDVVLWEPAVFELLPEVESNPIYQTLDVAADERDAFITGTMIAGAMAHSTVLSPPVVLDFLLPELRCSTSLSAHSGWWRSAAPQRSRAWRVVSWRRWWS